MDVDDNPFSIIRCEDARHLIESLRVGTSEILPFDREPYKWAYRGQADATWKLTPSALRPGVTLGFYPDRRHYVSKGQGASEEQINGEVIAVRQFAEFADRVGLPIPGFHRFFRQDGFDIGAHDETAAEELARDSGRWPEPDMLELLAIAQHHGVPTRLLDFTYDPLVAAFFAADDVVRNWAVHVKNGVTELAVWGVSLRKLYKLRRDFGIVEVQRATNPFLFAQKGLFPG
jgi:hypothetical protein